MVLGGPTASGISNSSRKAYAREILTVEAPLMKALEQVISFTDDDLDSVKFSHDEPLVIGMIVETFIVQKVLVDNGSSIDVFKEMSYKDDQLTPSLTPLYRFTGVETKIEGNITFLISDFRGTNKSIHHYDYFSNYKNFYIIQYNLR